MRKNLALIMIAVGLLGLSACDSREDWFDKNAPRPDLVVTIGDSVYTLTGSDSRVIEVDLHMIASSDWLLYTDTFDFHISGLSDGRGVPITGIYNLWYEGDRDLSRDEGDGYNYICYIKDINAFAANNDRKEIDGKIYAIATMFTFDSDTSAKVVTHTARIMVEDIFEGQNYYTLKINIIGDIPPTPVLKVQRLDYNYEYNLSLEESYDRDGKVAKYEWCIDGNIVPYDVKDYRFEFKNGVWQSGQAAYGGKYVKATTINSINHNFQSPGEHTVYYRCMDNLGAWSMWYSQTINVEE